MELVLEVLLLPFLACLVLTGIHTYLGLHVVARGVIFVDLALAQIAALGATFAFLLGYDPGGTQGYLYSLLFTFIGAAIFSISRLKDQRVPQEAIIGITFAVASAAAIMIADRAPQGAEFVEAMLTGALLWVDGWTVLKTALIYSAIGVFHYALRDRFLAISMEPQRVEAQGWNVRWWDFLFYTSFGFVITSSVAMAGVLLVFSFLVIPSVISMLWAHGIGARLAIGWTVGTLVSMVGLSLSYAYDVPSGPAVVCTFGAALLLAGVARYLQTAERTVPAMARVATATVLVGAGLWLAFSSGPTFQEAPSAAGEAGEPSANRGSAAAVGQALAALEGAEGEPPAAAIAELLAAGEGLHQMMITGQVTVRESAVRTLGRSSQEGVEELLGEFAYHADDPWARLRAGEALLARRNVLGVEPLIDLLAADHPPFLQLQAATALREATGQDFGFDPQADAESRQAAVQEWREWWQAHRSEGLPRRS